MTTPAPYLPPTVPPTIPPAVPPLPRPRVRELPKLRTLYRTIPGGRLLLVIGLFFGWSLLFIAFWPVIRSAHKRVYRVFDVDGPAHLRDRFISRVQSLRTALGLLVTLSLLFAYGTEDDVANTVMVGALRLAMEPWALIVSAPAVIALVIHWAPPTDRSWMRARLRTPVSAFLWYAGSLTVLCACTLLPGLLFEVFGLSEDSPTAGWIIVPAGFLWVWTMTFVLIASWTAVRSCFNIVEVHAALPALITALLVWEFAAIGLVFSGLPPGPPLVQALTLLGGPATVTAVAWWEIRRLRVHRHIYLRARPTTA